MISVHITEKELIKRMSKVWEETLDVAKGVTIVRTNKFIEKAMKVRNGSMSIPEGVAIVLLDSTNGHSYNINEVCIVSANERAIDLSGRKKNTIPKWSTEHVRIATEEEIDEWINKGHEHNFRDLLDMIRPGEGAV